MNKGWASNLGLKAVALFLAVLLWYFVSAPRREPVSERAFPAPLSIVNVPRDLVITTQLPDSVSVRLRGRASDLRSVSSQNLEVILDLKWAQPGDATITLRPQAINVPPDVEAVSIDPNRLRFRVEQLRQRIARIRPFLVGQVPETVVAGEPTVAPDQALISGPSSQIRNTAEVATERVIMTGRTDTFTQSVAVVSDSPLVRVIQPLAVLVTVPVLPKVGPIPATDTAEPDADTTTASSTATGSTATRRNRK
jgi:YbbR domain-containing protein